MMFDKHTNLKYKFGNRHFWAEGYYVSTVNEATIKIDSRLKELSSKWFFTSIEIREWVRHDTALDKLSVKEYENPFRD